MSIDSSFLPGGPLHVGSLVQSWFLAAMLTLGLACGGGGGGGGTSTPNASATAPVITSATMVCPPDTPSFRLTLHGFNFNSSSVLLVNGAPHQTIYQEPGTLSAYVNAQELASGGSCQVRNSSPSVELSGIKSIISGVITSTYQHPSMSPRQVTAGSPAFTLGFWGIPIDSNSTIIWNGAMLPTTVDLTAGFAHAAIPTAEVANPGYAVAALYNPGTGAITPPQVVNIIANLQVSSLVGAPSGGNLLGLASTTAISYPGSLIQLDPFTGQTNAILTSVIPYTCMAFSSDNSSLYLGSSQSPHITRMAWPGLNQIAAFDLVSSAFIPGTGAETLLAVPGSPGSVLVGQPTIFSPGQAIVIYDEGIARTKFGGVYGYGNCIAFDSAAPKLYALENGDSAFDLTAYSVDASGLSQIIQSTALKVTYGTGIATWASLVYTSSGLVIDPSTMTVLPKSIVTSNDPGFLLDPPNNRMYFVTYGDYQTRYLMVYDLTTFNQVGSLVLNGMTGPSQQIVRWGRNGLAILQNPNFGSSAPFIFQSDLVAPFL
jgi:hypothetical protein